MRRINGKHLVISLALVLALILSASCAYIDISTPADLPPPTPTPAAPPTPIDPNWTPPPSSNQTQALPSIADVVARVRPSVVAIDVIAEYTSYDFLNRPYTQEVEGAGSGWILDASGIIVTNNHVVEGAKEIAVTLADGRTITTDSSVLFTDAFNDLAILKIDAEGLPALTTGDSSKLRVGDWVVAIGNALGQGIRATEGIVSRQGVSIPVSEGQTLYDLIETSAAINPGNSGGPLVNMAGEVIGITSAKIANIGVEGMGYAISTETALPIIEKLVNNGYVIRPWLGISMTSVEPYIVARFRLAVEEGVFISQVVSGSPAEQAGLEAGDVIVKAGGKQVSTADELLRIIHSANIGEGMDITFWRGNKQISSVVVPVESPAQP